MKTLLTMWLTVAAAASAAYSPDFSGITINLLTEINTLIHNPEYWTAEFTNRTGARVNLVGMPQGELHPEMMAAARDRVNYYDLFIYQGQRIVDYVDCDTCDPAYRTLFEDLTDWIPQQPEIFWPDIAYYIRSFVGQYNGRIYALPLDGDVFYMYTNTELLGRYSNWTEVPRTWDEFNSVAAQVRDGLLAAGVNDTWAVCMTKGKNQVWPWYMFMFIAPYIQSLGTKQGIFFDPDTFEPLLDNDGVREALRQMLRTNEFDTPFKFQTSVDGTRQRFQRGKCAMTIDWGDIILLANKSDVTRGKVQVSRTPGSPIVWDRETRQLRPCTPDLCPYATDGINYASLAASGGWVAAVNHYSTGLRKQAALEFLKLIGSQRASNVDVTRGYGLDMCRVGQMTPEFWMAKGFTRAQAESTVGAVQGALNGPNTVNDLRITHNWDYEFGAVDVAVQQFLAGNKSAQEIIGSIVRDWSVITAAAGPASQLDSYRRTLGLPPRSRFDCSRLGCSPRGGRCVADDVCVCDDGWTGADCGTPIAVLALDADDPVAGVVLAIAALGALTTTALMVFLVRYGRERVVKAKSPLLMLLVGLGLLCGYGSVLCSIGRPTVASCVLEPVLLALCSALILAVLVAKTYRIKKIFRNPTLVVVGMRDSRVLRLAAMISLPNLILVVILVTAQTPQPIIRSLGPARFWTCQSDLPAQIAVKSLLLAYNFLVLAFGVVLAFQTRHVISEFNESKSIGDAVYVITFGTAIIFPLSFARLDLVVMAGLRLLITVTSLLLVQILLIGKIFFQFVLARSQRAHFSAVDRPKSGGLMGATNSRSMRITSQTAVPEAVVSARIEGQMFTVPVMRGGWMSSWASATIVIVPVRDLFAVVTQDGVGNTYKLSAMTVLKVPTPAGITTSAATGSAAPAAPSANNLSEDGVEHNSMFEIAFGSDRLRIDTLQTSIGDVLLSYAAAHAVTSGTAAPSRNTRPSAVGKNTA